MDVAACPLAQSSQLLIGRQDRFSHTYHPGGGHRSSPATSELEHRNIGRRRLSLLKTILVPLVIFFTILFVVPSEAGAHAFLDSSDPSPGSIVPVAPREARLRFTEPIEPDYSSAVLYDTNGRSIPTMSNRPADRPNELVVSLPPDLPKGTYSLQWRTVSAADGHPSVGYFTFTIGSLTDVSIPSSPPLPTVSFAPTWLNAAARVLTLLGIILLAGPLLFWRTVAAPPATSIPVIASLLARRFRRLTLLGAGIAILGTLVLLVIQLVQTSSTPSPGGALQLLVETRFGQFWLLRFAALLALTTTALRGHALPHQPNHWRDTILAALIGVIILSTALVSHAAAEPRGRGAVILNDALHVSAAVLWAGGLVSLLLTLKTLRESHNEATHALTLIITQRFSSLAMAAVALLVITGMYHAWLFVGNFTALLSTTYGLAIGTKIALGIGALLLGALNLLTVTRRLHQDDAAPRRLFQTTTLEVVLLSGVLLATGVASSVPPARAVLQQAARGVSVHFAEAGLHVQLQISPGAVGINRFTVDVASANGLIDEQTEVFLRLQSQSGLLQGEREIRLSRQVQSPAQQARFEATSSDLSVPGEWIIELHVLRPGKDEWQARTTIVVSRIPVTQQVPAPPPYFGGLIGAFAWAVVSLACPAFLLGLRHRKRVLVYGAVVALVVGVPTLLLSRTEMRNPVPPTADSIAQGRRLYETYCLRCHGATGLGNGPDASKLGWPIENMNLQAHLHQHSDEQLYWWIKEGKAGTPMPAFGTQLTDEEIWHLINYLRTLAPS